MKAIAQTSYGSADVLRCVDIEVPVPGDHDVLVRVQAAGLHIGDWHVMTGLPYLLRAVGFGLQAPRVQVRGIDVAGTVEAVGKNVTEFRAGDGVFGTCEGAFAEFASAPEQNLAQRPANVTPEQAAAVPTSAFAALQAVRDRGELQSGQQVLVVGATGGVGSFAVQLAKSYGAEVTGVCSTARIAAARALGADHVIDYALEDFTRSGRRYDLILDSGGNRSLTDLRRLLTAKGILVLIGGEGGNRLVGTTGKWIQALLWSSFVSQQLRPLVTTPNKKDLLILKELLEAGKITPVIDRTFPLSEAPDAFRYLEQRRAQGKIVITV